jgi:hypothetical protein
MIANPLYGLPPTDKGVRPLWKEGEPYTVVCFLSDKKTFQKL